METVLLVTLGAVSNPATIGLDPNILRILETSSGEGLSSRMEYRSMLIVSNVQPYLVLPI
jgi:hypothetical protein